jgi:Flp pilus assembly pilin Flp
MKRSPNRRPILNQSGQGLTEYLILLVLVSVACITAVTTLGNTIQDKLQIARNKINSGISMSDMARD